VSHEPDMQAIADDIRKLGYYPFHLPLGLKLNEVDRTKSPCIRCDTFDGYPCLVQAKPMPKSMPFVPVARLTLQSR
jgi:hypothetical protein